MAAGTATGIKVMYTGKTHTTGGRDGASRTSDGRLDVKLSPPGLGDGTNPEQLFAAGWSACFLSSMRLAAGKMKVRFPADAAIDAEVDLCNRGNDDYIIQGRLNISLPGIDRETAQALAEAGERICTYSKAVKGNVEVVIRVV